MRLLYMLSPMALAVLLATLQSAAAMAQPNAATSTFDPVIGFSPQNNCVSLTPATRYRYSGTLRNAAGAPVANFPAADVVLDFSLCTRQTSRPVTIPADYPSSSTGVVLWDVSLAHGGADPCGVRVLVGGEEFYVLAAHQGLPGPSIDGGIRSPDDDGDGDIDLLNLSTFQQEFVNTGARRDYLGDLARPFDGITALGDLVTYQAHFACQ